MKTLTNTLIPTLALSFGIFTNCFAEYEEKIVANDAAAIDNFGGSVSIDGDYAIAGATGDDNVGSASGSAYIFLRSGTSWSQQAKIVANDAAHLDQFGQSVSISGDYAIVGANGDDDGGSGSGSAYIFFRTGTSWTQQAKLTANDAASSDNFGFSVSISGDYAVVGAMTDDDGGSGSGSAYVFVRSGTSWSQQAKLTAADASGGDNLGRSVSIDGSSIICGALGDDDGGSNSGSAYVFVRSGTSWSQQAKLTAADAASNDQFGLAVSINGDYAIAGASGDDNVGSGSGSAYVFVRSGTSWSQQAKLTADDAADSDFYGTSVTINGSNALVGSPYSDTDGSTSGSAYIYQRSGTSWSQHTKLTSDDAAAGDQFGNSVSLSSEYAIVGSFLDSDAGNQSGSAYIYLADGGDLPLAVELDSFQARQIENKIHLNWTTASEKDNEGFNVYRQTGNGFYTQIASYKGNLELQGALNSSTAHNYTFVDDSELKNGETYTYYVSDIETNGIETKHVDQAQTVRFTLNEEIAQTKLDYVLAQNFPNPFNPSTTINFQIAKTQDVKLQVYNLNGKLVKELVNNNLNKGSHSVNWDGTDSFGNQVSSGTYFYKISVGTFTQTNKMILLK